MPLTLLAMQFPVPCRGPVHAASGTGVRTGARCTVSGMTSPASTWLAQRWQALVCGLITVAAVVLNQWASRWPELRLSHLLHVADTDPLAGLIRTIDPDFRFVSGVEHYDGVYYYAIAVDPFATGEAHQLIDMAAYRYGSPLWGWLAGLFSGGHAPLLPVVFWLMTLASVFAAAYLLSRLVSWNGGSPWWGLAVAASPGMLYSSFTVLTEPLQVVLICATLLWWRRGERGSPWVLALLVVATCLLKQQLVLVALALLLDSVVKMLRGRPFRWGRTVAVLAGPAAYVGWITIVRQQFTGEQLIYDAGSIGWPFVGWLETFQMASYIRGADPYAMQIGTTAASGMIATGVILLIGTVAGLRRLDALGLLVTLQTGLVFCLGWLTLLHPHELYRIPAVPVVMALASIGIGLKPRHKAP